MEEMEEENEKKQDEETKTTPQENEEDSKTPYSVKAALEAAKRLEEANKRMEENIKRTEELKAFETLGGKSEGKQQEEPKKEDTPEEYADKALRGQIQASE